MKFETVCHFLRDNFGLLSFRKFATMPMGRNDFSLLSDTV